MEDGQNDHEILPEFSAIDNMHKFICDELVNGKPCGMDFLTEEALFAHKPTHPDTKVPQMISEPGTSADNCTFTCDQIVNGDPCGRSFPTSRGLFCHESRAPGHKLFVPKPKKIMILKHADGTFKCDEIIGGEPCGKSFPSWQAQSWKNDIYWRKALITVHDFYGLCTNDLEDTNF